MKSYVFIKIGGSSLMLNMISKLLARSGSTNFNCKMLEGMIIVKFESGIDRANLAEMFDSLNLVNYFLCDELDMSCNLTEKMNEGLNISSAKVFHTDPVKRIADLDAKLKHALENEQYEDASKIRDEIDKLKNTIGNQ